MREGVIHRRSRDRRMLNEAEHADAETFVHRRARRGPFGLQGRPQEQIFQIEQRVSPCRTAPRWPGEPSLVSVRCVTSFMARSLPRAGRAPRAC